MKIFYTGIIILRLPKWRSGKEFTCQYRRFRRHELDPCVRKIPWRREWLPIPVFLLENSMDRGAWQATVHAASKESDTPECTHTHNYSQFIDRKVEAPIS